VVLSIVEKGYLSQYSIAHWKNQEGLKAWKVLVVALLLS
jgi:hypothetical protein